MIPWRAGRSDADDGSKIVPDGRLPDATQGAAHLRDVFYRMGFNDKDIVALSGAHSMGRYDRIRGVDPLSVLCSLHAYYADLYIYIFMYAACDFTIPSPWRIESSVSNVAFLVVFKLLAGIINLCLNLIFSFKLFSRVLSPG